MRTWRARGREAIESRFPFPVLSFFSLLLLLLLLLLLSSLGGSKRHLIVSVSATLRPSVVVAAKL